MFRSHLLCLVLTWISINVLAPTSAAETYLFDFTNTDGVDDWQEQSDTVRAVGLSKADIVIQNNTDYRRAVFFALLNPQSNGAGFAGMRIIQTFDLSSYSKFQIQCRGQGEYKGFKVVLRHKGLIANSDNTYEQFFQAPADDFAVVDLPFSGFEAYFRGQVVNNTDPLDTSQISAFGLQMYGGVYENVKQSGPSTLEVDWVKAVA